MIRAFIATLILSMAAFAGVRSTLVMTVNFQDRPDQPFTREYAQSVGASVNNYYIEQSNGQAGFTFDVIDWQTLPMNFVCDENQIAALAEQAAVNAGYNPSNYQHKIYAFPGAGCGWTGSAVFSGNQVWINTSFDLASVAHELGHNLGLYHSSFQYPSGSILDTGDRFDVMGSSQSAHFNLYQKEKLGWVMVPDVPTGVYYIPAHETGIGIKVHSTDGWYYIERRTSFGFDSILLQGINNSLDGFLIHYKGSYRSPLLLDMTPETSSIYDSALTPGRSFDDGTVSITALDSENVSVTVPIVTPTPTPVPTPTPTPVPTPTPCKKYNAQGKCVK